jgi:hypothetical protein
MGSEPDRDGTPENCAPELAIVVVRHKVGWSEKSRSHLFDKGIVWYKKPGFQSAQAILFENKQKTPPTTPTTGNTTKSSG